MVTLKDFIISRVRVKLLKIFFDDPKEMYYVRQLTRMTVEEINAVRRELTRLNQAGIIKKEVRGNRIYYCVDQTYDFFEDILGLILKSTGLGVSLRQNKAKLGKIKFAMISGKFALRKKREPADVDLLVVGEIVLPELSILIQKEQERLKTEINYTVMTDNEFMFRKSRRDPFLLNILSKSRVMLIGDEEGLVDKTVQNEE